MIPGRTYTPGDLAVAAWRRRWWIVGSFAVLAAVALAVVVSVPRRYQSVATIQILSEPATDALGRTAANPPQGERLSSIGQATLTRARLEEIVETLNLYPDLRRVTVMETVVKTMREDITFASTDRDVFQLGFTSSQPQVAYAVATRLTSLFLEENARYREQRAEATRHFVDAQLEEARQKLDEQERQIDAYKVKYSGELPSQLSLNLQELNNAQATLRALLDSVARDQDERRLLQLEQTSADTVVPSGSGTLTVPGGGSDGSAGAEIDQLETARAALRALELRMTPEHPDVQRMKRTIARLEQQRAADLAALRGGAPTTLSLRRRDPIRARQIEEQLTSLDRRIAASQAEIRRVRATIDSSSRRIEAAPARESELATLSRDYEETKKLYSSLVARKQDAAMAADLERKDLGGRFRVIDPARLPERAAGQGRTADLLVGLLAAFALSFGIAAVVEYRDSSLWTDVDITATLRLPVLATIPDLSRPARGRLR